MFLGKAWNSQRLSKLLFVLIVCFSKFDTLIGQTHASIDVYTVTGVEFFTEIMLHNYELELEKTVDDITTKTPVATEDSALCTFNRNAELVLDIAQANGSAVACRLTVFRKGDRLAQGWSIERMQWRGDLRQTRFIVEPEGTKRPQFVIEIVHRKNDKLSKKAKRVRLLVVRLSGPKGGSWKDAFK